MTEGGVEGSARRALRQGAGILALTFGMSFAVNLMRLAGPMFAILIYDRVLPARSAETLVALFAMVAAILIVQGILDYARKRILARFGAQFQERLETLLFAHLSQQDMFDPSRSKPAAGLDELDGLRAFFHSSSLIALFDFFWTPMFVAVVFIFHPVLGWICLGGIAAMFVLSLVQMAFMGERLARSSNASRTIGGLKNMLVASRDVVRAQEMSAGYKARWLQARALSRDRAIELKDWTMWFDSLSGTVLVLVRYGVLAAGAYLTLTGAVSIGAMVAATFLVTRVLVPVERFMGELPNITEAFRNWGRLSRILSEQYAPPVAPLQTPGSARWRLSLEGVMVRSPITGGLILKGVTLDVPPGTMVQITAGSGRGKTVLAQVVLGLWRRVSGTILIDGINIERLTDAQTAKIFGYVPEMPGFIAGTLAENIARLDPDPAPEKLAAAAKQACLHGFVSALPEGYQTLIDAHATTLSRGQRHQLALARALYRQPDILILDEPDGMLTDTLPETMDKTFTQFLKRGGVILALSRKPLNFKQISASYRLEAGKLKPVTAPAPLARPKLAALSPAGATAVSAKRG